MKQLKYLNIAWTKLTPDDVAELKKSLPNTKISFYQIRPFSSWN